MLQQCKFNLFFQKRQHDWAFFMIEHDPFVTTIKLKLLSVLTSVRLSVFADYTTRSEELMKWRVTRTRIRGIGIIFSDFLIKREKI